MQRLGLSVLVLLLTVALAAACESDNSGDSSAQQGLTGVSCDEAAGTCTLSGEIYESMTLTKDTIWLLRGGVFIGDDTTETVLTVEAGTEVYGIAGTTSPSMLVIRRGSKIMAEGTAAEPIVFSSSKDVGSRTRGDWGGIIINGRATINNCAEDTPDDTLCQAYGEGGTGWFGGTDDSDDSGVLQYVRIEYAGRILSPDNELNGLALQGVGSGTTLDYIQIHMGKDDGVEFFGGTCNFKHLLCTGIADDNLDWTDGWRGKGQFFLSVQYEDAGDNGIEADNNGEKNDATPRSFPMLSNLTLVGVPSSEKSDLGMLLREGTAADISNAVVYGWNDACLDIDHKETFTNGSLSVTNSIVACATSFKDFDDDDLVDPDDESSDPIPEAFAASEFFQTMMTGNETLDFAETGLLADPWAATPSFAPQGEVAAKAAAVPSDAFFEQVDFVGGVDPDDDWTAGWTNFDKM